MTLRDFLLAITGITLISWVAWVVVLLFLNPTAAGVVGIGVFYASLFLALLGTGTILGLGVRMTLRKMRQEHALAFKLVLPALRQSFWFALLIVISLWLLASDLFAWWSLVMLLVALAVLEAFYLFQEQTSKSTPPVQMSKQNELTDNDLIV